MYIHCSAIPNGGKPPLILLLFPDICDFFTMLRCKDEPFCYLGTYWSFRYLSFVPSVLFPSLTSPICVNGLLCPFFSKIKVFRPTADGLTSGLWKEIFEGGQEEGAACRVSSLRGGGSLRKAAAAGGSALAHESGSERDIVTFCSSSMTLTLTLILTIIVSVRQNKESIGSKIRYIHTSIIISRSRSRS